MMKLKPAALATLALLSSMAMSAEAQVSISKGKTLPGAESRVQRKTYIVQLKDEPAVTYQGTIAGLAATAPAPGENFRYGRPEVLAYNNYLDQNQVAVAATVGSNRILAKYTNVFNGFAILLSDAEAITLSTNAKVAGLWEDEARHMDTISTSKFLGLSVPGGLWSQTAGGNLVKGENMVIGVVDGGIWPENPAFFDRQTAGGVPSNNPADAQVYGPKPATFTGACVVGTGITAASCNNKLVSIRHFNAGFNASGQTLHWTDFANSGRDSVGGATGHGGHGDHTASTAAGNSNVTAIVNGLALGQASGMAPRARVAAYKVCWTYVNAAATDGTGSQNSCYNSDSVSAIDQAVADGVNVINYSISGSQTTVNDPVEQAFYRAALAGVFVAASAGNSGPGQAVAHISPWLTTVAASTHDRLFSADAVLGTSVKYTGASMNQTALGATALIRAEDAGITGASANLNLCFSSPNELDPAKVAGKIVICTRGNNARVDKSLAVLNAGGVGMIMADNGAGLVAEAHSVPTVHVSQADGNAIKTYAQTAGATSTISQFYIGTAPAPIMASFSSRGPNGGDGNVLKPDLTAPGVDVIAQVTPALTQAQVTGVGDGSYTPGPDWASYQGTSMSSPHVAGVALLLKQAHPTWGPAAIKSALMTSAYSTLADAQTGLSAGLLPWSQGAGHIAPNKATDPGLVYDSGKNDWIKYQCKVNPAAITPASDCTTIGKLAETSDLNLPSMTASAVLGTVTFPRTVTNVGTATATYTANVPTVAGFTTVVTPSSLNLAPGASASFTVKLTATTAVEGAWSYGELIWSDGTHSVRAPIQAKVGKPISVPATEYTDTKVSGSKLFTVKTGFAGKMGITKGGMKEVTMGAPVTLTPDASVNLATACAAGVDTPAVKVYSFTVPANTIVARWALRNADVSAAADDNDLYVLPPTGAGTISGSSSSNEAVQLLSPAAGTYRVCVTAYGSANATSTHSLSSWIVAAGDGSGLNALVPSVVYAGGNATVGLSWSGLVTGKRYVGGVQFLDGGNVVQATTALRISTDGSVPVLNDPLADKAKPAVASAE